MADVQAVNIWTGAEWVEIAQPIADGGNVGDVLTWSGSEWAATAPGGLPIGTAEGQLLQWDGAGWNTTGEGNADGQLLVWDDLNKRWLPMADIGTDGSGKPIKPILPIGSEDGTVVLGSPVANTFTIHTGGTERLRVRADGAVGVGYAGQADINFAVYLPFSSATLTETGILAAPQFDDKPSQDCFSVQSQPQFNAGIKAARMSHFYATDGRVGNAEMPSTTQIGLRIGDLQKGQNNVGVQIGVNEDAGKNNFAIDCGGNAPSRFFGEIHCNTLKSYAAAAGDATIGLTGQVMTVSTAGTERLRVTGSGQVGIGRTVPAAGPFVAMKAERNVANAVGCSLWMVPGAAATTSYGYYSAPELGATNTAYATHIHYMAIGIPSMPSGSSLTQEWMFYANPTAQTDHAIVGFRSGLNDNGQAGTYAIHVAGSAQSRFDSQVVLNGGSAAAPGLAAVGDENTGFFMPSADVAAISTDGTERLRVTAQGQITAAAGYTPAADQDLATRKYVDDQMALVGGGSVSTADVNLSNPTRSLGRFTPPTDLATQEDANQAIGDAIAERKIVLPISRVDYDALPVKDPDTLYLITS